MDTNTHLRFEWRSERENSSEEVNFLFWPGSLTMQSRANPNTIHFHFTVPTGPAKHRQDRLNKNLDSIQHR